MSDIEEYNFKKYRRSPSRRRDRSHYRSRSRRRSTSSNESVRRSHHRSYRYRDNRKKSSHSYRDEDDLKYHDRAKTNRKSRSRSTKNDKKSQNEPEASQETSSQKKKKRTGWDNNPGNPVAPLLLTPTATGFTAVLAGKSPEEAATLAASLQFKSHATQLCRIYVGSLDYSLTDQDIRQVFSAFGPIISVDMPKEGSRSKGFCFIEYATPEAAQMAITTMPGFNLKGRAIKVGRPTALGGGATGIPSIGLIKDPNVNAAEAGQLAAAMFLANSDNNASNNVSPEPLNRIYVGSVPSTFTSEDIKQIFDVFGKILSCDLIPSAENPAVHRGYGFIEYSTVDEAKLAIETMNNFAISGKILKVTHASAVRSLGLEVPSSGYSQLISGATAALMAAPIPPDQIPPLPSDVSKLSILLLKDMVDPQEANNELKEEIRQECTKYGDIYDIAIISDANKKVVRIFVIFNNKTSADTAVPMLHDRWFGGRRINASTYDPELYQSEQFWV